MTLTTGAWLGPYDVVSKLRVRMVALTRTSGLS